jgi:hypothetical protein
MHDFNNIFVCFLARKLNFPMHVFIEFNLKHTLACLELLSLLLTYGMDYLLVVTILKNSSYTT